MITATKLDLQELSARHLWRSFSPVAKIGETTDTPIIVKGDGCYVWDSKGNRYLDGLSSLYCVNVGHGRRDIGLAGAEQAAELAYFPAWGHAHPQVIELAARIASLTPGDLNRVFMTSGGSESVESAIKLARQYHRMNGQPGRTKIIARELAYHGTTLGALAATGIQGLRDPFTPVTPGGCHVPNTDTYRNPEADGPSLAEHVKERIEAEGPDTVAAVIMEPVQTATGCLVPPDGYFERVLEICSEYGILFISDEVICSWGRLGEWFGATRYGYQPDIVTTAKGLTSAYAPMGAMIVSDAVAEKFTDENAFLHGFTFAGHPVAAAVALANIDVIETEGMLEHVRTNEPTFREALESLSDIDLVAEVRGAGYFLALKLVKDRETKEAFDPVVSAALVQSLKTELFEHGLICRVDDRSDPAIQFAPPLIAGEDQFNEIVSIVRPILERASKRIHLHPSP
jgi:adenosylmethionine-8-amino-7-oxononanoate aminotransferase